MSFSPDFADPVRCGFFDCFIKLDGKEDGFTQLLFFSEPIFLF